VGQTVFDDLTNTFFQGHHQPLKTWVICLYLMGLNLSNAQIAMELGISESDSHAMTSLLREGIYEKRPQEIISNGHFTFFKFRQCHQPVEIG